MQFLPRVLPIALMVMAATAGAGEAQSARLSSSDTQASVGRFRWSVGLQGGALFFTTQRQTQSGMPAAGAHISVMSRRGGVQLGFEEGFGSAEPSAFVDPNSNDQVREVVFERLRRYGVTLTGYPVRGGEGGGLEPYLGVGFGMIQAVDWTFGEDEVFESAGQAGLATFTGNERSASAFASFLAGVQVRVGSLSAFGQYQISTAPRGGDFLRGTGHSLLGGVRFWLGSGREEVRSR
ncbi:MAG TPA: hypothetical protein VI383_11290 [Gemmatimonadales bacterium]|nr:hypothetical protein [Gemmatimonadales bacterium]